MGMLSSRALPRLFFPEADAEAAFELPKDELNKLRNVLRLSSGAQIGVLPGDGRLIRCELRGREAVPIEILEPQTEPTRFVRLAQALPKGDKLEDVIRACTPIGVSEFVLFPSDRTVVRWDERKFAERLGRLAVIARESAELSFRTRVPTLIGNDGLAEVLTRYSHAQALSEGERVSAHLDVHGGEITIVVGPEGGWSPREMELIGDRGVTLGPRVLRTEHAGAAAAALLLLG